jgi:hypothetical protein
MLLLVFEVVMDNTICVQIHNTLNAYSDTMRTLHCSKNQLSSVLP